jgi:hypothetical protein
VEGAPEAMRAQVYQSFCQILAQYLPLSFLSVCRHSARRKAKGQKGEKRAKEHF